jgi:hypothetical protein
LQDILLALNFATFWVQLLSPRALTPDLMFSAQENNIDDDAKQNFAT